MSGLLLAFAALSSTALTQTAAVEPFDRSRFLPDGYHNITHLDLRAMRESGVWDEISTGPMRLMLKQAEQFLGFPLAKLDRATITPQATPPGSDGPRPCDLSVTIFAGNAALELPPMMEQLGLEEVKVGPLTIMRRDDTVYCQPTLFVRLVATGDPDDPHLQIEAVLRHPQAAAGLDVTAAAITALLERGAKSPKFRAVAPLLQDVELERDGTDLSFTIDFGRARAASGKAAELLGPLLAPRQRQRDNDR